MLWRINVLVYFVSLIISRDLDAYEASLINTLGTKINLNYIERVSSYRTVNTLLSYKTRWAT